MRGDHVHCVCCSKCCNSITSNIYCALTLWTLCRASQRVACTLVHSSFHGQCRHASYVRYSDEKMKHVAIVSPHSDGRPTEIAKIAMHTHPHFQTPSPLFRVAPKGTVCFLKAFLNKFPVLFSTSLGPAFLPKSAGSAYDSWHRREGTGRPWNVLRVPLGSNAYPCSIRITRLRVSRSRACPSVPRSKCGRLCRVLLR